MQACIYERYGSPEVVHLAEVARPAIAQDELLVRVRAAAVTTADWRLRASVFPPVFWLAGRLMLGLLRPRNPILGMDFSGVVEATGSRVTRFRPGDLVFGAASATRRGAHAEYLAVSESGAVIAKPDGLSHPQAAAIPFGANTALAFVRDVARVQPGQRVLVIGASGAVGVWAVQLAHHFGAEVTGVCSARNVELVRELGARRAIDYASEPYLTGSERYDLIFDTVGVTSFAACKTALSECGMFLPLSGGGREITDALFTALRPGKKVKWAVSANTRAGLKQVAALIAAGTLRPVVDRVYPMAQIAEAHRHVDSRHKRGAVIVEIGG